MMRRNLVRLESLKLIAPNDNALTLVLRQQNTWKVCEDTTTATPRIGFSWSVI